MNASSSEVVAPASTELTTPAKITPKPTSAIAAAASQALREASVPTQMNTAPTSAERHVRQHPVTDRAAEVDQQQHREGTERREGRELRVVQHLCSDGEHRRHHDRGPAGPAQRGEAAIAFLQSAYEIHPHIIRHRPRKGMIGCEVPDRIRSVATTAVDQTGWGTSAAQSARRLAVITAAGALLGLLVGGVGGRLAMMLLARLNPEVTGVISDDGFRMGQFTLRDTLSLLLVAVAFGVAGAGVYAVVRGLLLGPRWFQITSVAAGPAVVVGAAIVHTEGVDFQLLEPAWLAIGLFVAIPAAYAALLTVVAERWLREGGWASRAPLWVVGVPLLLWIPLFPFLFGLVLLWVLRETMRQSAFGANALAHPALPWVGRLGLSAVFLQSLLDLGMDATELI